MASVPLPSRLARFNRVATNRITRPVAGYLPGFGIVMHQGRRSGRRYRTPVNVFRRPGGFDIALTYGERSEWVRNVLAAGSAELTTRGRTHHVTHPRIVRDRGRAPVPRLVRPVLALLDVDRFLAVDEDQE